MASDWLPEERRHATLGTPGARMDGEKARTRHSQGLWPGLMHHRGTEVPSNDCRILQKGVDLKEKRVLVEREHN